MCDPADLRECLRNPGSNACQRARECHSAWLEVRWLCRILPELLPPLPLPRPDPPPPFFPGIAGGDADPWPIDPRIDLMRNAFETELLLDLLAPSRFHRTETALPSATAFVRREGLVPAAARNLAKRLAKVADLLGKEAELMERQPG